MRRQLRMEYGIAVSRSISVAATKLPSPQFVPGFMSTSGAGADSRSQLRISFAQLIAPSSSAATSADSGIPHQVFVTGSITHAMARIPASHRSCNERNRTVAFRLIPRPWAAAERVENGNSPFYCRRRKRVIVKSDRIVSIGPGNLEARSQCVLASVRRALRSNPRQNHQHVAGFEIPVRWITMRSLLYNYPLRRRSKGRVAVSTLSAARPLGRGMRRNATVRFPFIATSMAGWDPRHA